MTTWSSCPAAVGTEWSGCDANPCLVDTFTGVDGTYIENHTPDNGGPWEAYQSSGPADVPRLLNGEAVNDKVGGNPAAVMAIEGGDIVRMTASGSFWMGGISFFAHWDRAFNGIYLNAAVEVTLASGSVTIYNDGVPDGPYGNLPASIDGVYTMEMTWDRIAGTLVWSVSNTQGDSISDTTAVTGGVDAPSAAGVYIPAKDDPAMTVNQIEICPQ